MTPHGLARWLGAMVVVGSLPAAAADQPIVAVDFDGCATVVDTEKVLSELALDLGADEVQPTTVLPLDANTPGDAMHVRIRCAEKSFEVVIRIDSREPASLWLTDTTGGVRARTLALALAERIRMIRLEPPPQPTPAPAVATAAHVAESVRAGPYRNEKNFELERTIALSLAVATVVGFAVGSPIAAVGDAHANDGGLRGAGATILGISCLPLIGGAVAFGYWMRERSLPP